MATCCDIEEKFQRPSGEVFGTGHWVVLARPKQVTLGSLILLSRRHATSLGDLSSDESADLAVAAHRLERLLDSAFSPDKLNYLALMMLDPHLHFHVIPRYSKPQTFAGYEFSDPAWGGPPDLGNASPDGATYAEVVATLRSLS